MADKRPIIGPSQFSELTNSDGLVAGQSAVLSEQASSPATPASGYGIVYAKTDGKLYFKNDAGTETDLTATGSGTNPVIREYIANDTWTKPTASNFWGALIICFGAGGGGGSGRRGAANSVRYGGGGGSGGTYASRLYLASELTLASYSITVGAGGSGSNPITTNDTSGNNGGSGGSTIVHSVTAVGGLNGSGGTNSVGLGGSGRANTLNLPPNAPYSIGSSSGIASQVGTSPSTSNVGYAILSGGGGTGGGGISGTNTIANGGAGGGIYDRNAIVGTALAGTTAGTRNGGNGTDNAALYLLIYGNARTYGPGTAGGGGATGDAAGTVAGGNAGTSGKCAGGSGGGASTNGANSGAGAAGGGGLVYIVEFYGA